MSTFTDDATEAILDTIEYYAESATLFSTDVNDEGIACRAFIYPNEDAEGQQSKRYQPDFGIDGDSVEEGNYKAIVIASNVDYTDKLEAEFAGATKRFSQIKKPQPRPASNPIFWQLFLSEPSD